MIYVDSSVAVASVLAETRRPPEDFWEMRVVASRLTDLETRVRVLRDGSSDALERDLDRVVSRINFVEVERRTVGLLYRDVPKVLRALDAIHLATLEFFNREVGNTALATYDRRLAVVAHEMGFDVLAP